MSMTDPIRPNLPQSAHDGAVRPDDDLTIDEELAAEGDLDGDVDLDGGGDGDGDGDLGLDVAGD
jgi:hypothetical protein